MTPIAHASVLGVLFAMFSQACCAMGWVGTDLAGAPCSGSRQGYGPYDYTDPRTRKGGKDAPLSLVERYHFTPDVENLVGGNTSLGPEGDLNYTITAFPNHHRALKSGIEWATIGPNGGSRRPVF